MVDQYVVHRRLVSYVQELGHGLIVQRNGSQTIGVRRWVRAFLHRLLLALVAALLSSEKVRDVCIRCYFINVFKNLRRIDFYVALGIVRTQQHRKDFHDASIERQFLPV